MAPFQAGQPVAEPIVAEKPAGAERLLNRGRIFNLRSVGLF